MFVYLRIRKLQSSGRSCCRPFYWFLILMCWLDVVIAVKVIELTGWSAFVNVNAAKMILSLASVKILSEIDDIFARYYVKNVVRITEDGIALLKHQGFVVEKDEEDSFHVALKLDFYQHRDLTL